MVLLHGWPDSVLRFERLLPLVTEVKFVIPALPGFPFARSVPERGQSSEGMAESVAAAMAALGYERYVVSAGDVGCDVAEALAAKHPENVSALHLTDVSQHHFLVTLPRTCHPPSETTSATAGTGNPPRVDFVQSAVPPFSHRRLDMTRAG